MRKTLILSTILIFYALPIVIFATEDLPSEKDPEFVKQEETGYALYEGLNGLLGTLSKRIPGEDNAELYDVKNWEDCLISQSNTDGSSGGAYVSVPALRKILSNEGYKLNLRMVSYTKELKEALKSFQITHGTGGIDGALDKGSGLVGPETNNFLYRLYGCTRPERIEQRKNRIVDLYIKYLHRLPTADELNNYAQRQFSLDVIDKVLSRKGKENTAGVNSTNPSFNISLSKESVVFGDSVTIRWLAKNIKVPNATIYVTNLSKLYLPYSESNTGFAPAPWAVVAYDVPVSKGYFVWETDNILEKPSTRVPSIVPATDYLIAIEVLQDGKTIRSEITDFFEIKENREIKKTGDLNNLIESKNDDKNIQEVVPNTLKKEPVVYNENVVTERVINTEKKGFFGSIVSFFKRLFSR